MEKNYNIGLILFLLITVPAIVYLVSQQQDVRNRAQVSGATISLSPGTQTVAPNVTFPVEVRINTNGGSVNAVQANLTYPANTLEVVSVDGAGSAFEIQAQNTFANGTINIGRGTQTPVSGDALVAIVTFKALTTGTADVNFSSGTALLDSQTNQDILGQSNGGSYTIASAASGTLSLSPASSTVNTGSNFTVQVRMNSGNATVNAVQANLTYPANLVDVGSIDYAGSAFEIQAQNTFTNGTITIGRGTQNPASGDKLIATITFQAKTTAGTANITFQNSSALVSSTTNANILSSSSGGSYTISAAATPTPTIPASTATPTPTPPVATATPTPSIHCASGTFTATLAPETGVLSNGTGVGTLVLNASETTGTLTVSFSGLLSAQTAAHIHGPASIGQSAGIVFTLPNGSFSGHTINLTSQQRQDLKSGLYYVNVHTQNNINGEIRGQLLCSSVINTPTPTTTAKRGDFNGNGQVDIIDYGLFFDHFGENPASDARFDLNTNGQIDIVDYGIFFDNFGQ